MAKKPVMLMILDGWGIAPPGPYNAAYVAKTPNLDSYFAKYPHTQLGASGEDVGLPDGQMGNSEVGHLNIGAGRIIYQELTRITKSIKDGDFFTNKVLLDAMQDAKNKNSSLHLLGLVSPGGVHSHVDHLLALVKMAKEQGLTKVYVHAFLDGRDVPPKSAAGYLADLDTELKKIGLGRIASVSGRYYAMDRDKRWERVHKAYNCLVDGDGAEFVTAEAGIQTSYAGDVTDEFVIPFRVAPVDKDSLIKNGDSVIFFNFRPDRARELTRALNDKTFDGFERPGYARPLHYVCMTQYDATIDAPVAFGKAHYDNTLGEVLAKSGKYQLRIAETEKYAHVTFFFNGGEETPNPLEDRLLIPSPKVATYDLQPEMSCYQVTDTLLKALDEDKYDAIILNFANPDMVGHTGILEAAVKALEAIDTCAGKVVEKVLSLDGTVCITADHGNCEKMQEEDGTPCTAHTTNPVPFIVVSQKEHQVHEGRLCDIAPTLLELLNIPKPAEMTGSTLLDK